MITAQWSPVDKHIDLLVIKLQVKYCFYYNVFIFRLMPNNTCIYVSVKANEAKYKTMQG